MALTDYCAFDEIRAALGVNDEELANDVLALPIYEIGLARELKKISPSLPAAFSAARDTDPATDQSQALVDAVRMFSAYAVAKQVGVSLALMAPKDVGDGKATLSRFSGTPYEDTMSNVKEALADARAALADAYATYSGGNAATVRVPLMFVAAGRGVDPVTGS